VLSDYVSRSKTSPLGKCLVGHDESTGIIESVYVVWNQVHNLPECIFAALDGQFRLFAIGDVSYREQDGDNITGIIHDRAVSDSMPA